MLTLPATKTQTCTRCSRDFTPGRSRQRTCNQCRFETDPKTSFCPFCGDLYTSHGTSSAEVAERWHHAKAKCSR